MMWPENKEERDQWIETIKTGIQVQYSGAPLHEPTDAELETLGGEESNTEPPSPQSSPQHTRSNTLIPPTLDFKPRTNTTLTAPSPDRKETRRLTPTPEVPRRLTPTNEIDPSALNAGSRSASSESLVSDTSPSLSREPSKVLTSSGSAATTLIVPETAQVEAPEGANIPASVRSPTTSDSSAQDVSAVPREKEGWLMKKGQKRRNWTKRWFVLKPGNLSYYTDQKKKTLKGTMPLNEKTLTEDSDTKPFCFYVENADRKTFVTAKDEQERKEWIIAINFSMLNSNP